MPGLFRHFSILLVAVICSVPVRAQDSGIGVFYSYGPYFNLHRSNSDKMRPSDGSTMGVYYQLDNGRQALGFRATAGWRHNDARIRIAENTYIHNEQQSLELKLQCTMHLNDKNLIAFGFGPRVIMHSAFNIEYKSSINGTTYEEHIPLPAADADLNELNTNLCFSWLHRISSRLWFAVNLDQDMLTAYRGEVNLDKMTGVSSKQINFLNTGLNASLILSLH